MIFFKVKKYIFYAFLLCLLLPFSVWAQEKDNPCNLPLLDCSSKKLCQDCGRLNYDGCPDGPRWFSCASERMRNNQACTFECLNKMTDCDGENSDRSTGCTDFISALSSSWFTNFVSALFSWDSTSWEGMKQYAIGHWQSMAQAAEKEGSPLEYLYKLMGFLAEQGSRGNLALLALSVIPFASLGKLFASGNLGPKLTLDIINSSLSNIAVVFKELPSGLAGIAGIGNGVKYTQAGTVAIKQALAGNPIASVISKHEIAHLLGASEVQAWKITSQAFSALSIGEKLRSLGTLAGVNTGLYWLLSKTLPTLNNTLLQAQYLFTKGITKNIWRGYK